MTSVLSFKFSRNGEKVMIQSKKNVSDEEWIGNSDGQGHVFFQDQSIFDLSVTPPNGPKLTDKNVLNNIRINIDSCFERIKNNQDCGAIIQELNSEFRKLAEPVSVPFHWDTSIYQEYIDEDGENMNDISNEEYLKLTSDIRNKRNEYNLFKITHKSGREKFNINDFVVCRTGFTDFELQMKMKLKIHFGLQMFCRLIGLKVKSNFEWLGITIKTTEEYHQKRETHVIMLMKDLFLNMTSKNTLL